MIRWSESSDAYRVTVSKLEVGAAVYLIACTLTLVLLGQGGILPDDLRPSRLPRPRDPFGDALLAAVVVICIVIAHGQMRVRAWVEIPIRSGAIRWWHARLKEPVQSGNVDRFAVKEIEGGYRTVVALLSDGAPQYLFGVWTDHSQERVRALADALNDRLSESRSNPPRA